MSLHQRSRPNRDLRVHLQRATLIGPRGGRIKGWVALNMHTGDIEGLGMGTGEKGRDGLLDTLSMVNGKVHWQQIAGVYRDDVSIRDYESGRI